MFLPFQIHSQLLACLLLLTFSFIKSCNAKSNERHSTLRSSSIKTTKIRNPSYESLLNVEPSVSRIINGEDAIVGRFPYLVDLDNVNGDHACMGSLVAPDWVLTAAHCLPVVHKANVGRYYHDNRKSSVVESFNIVKKIRHPNYNDFTLSYDYMLLKLDGKSKHSILNLNYNSSFPTLFENVTVAGFGDTNAGLGLRLPTVLQQVTLQAVSNEACSRVKTTGGLTLQGMIGPDEMCAFRQDHDACQGDSGGPLLVLGETPQDDVQVGVVSWGIGCGSTYIPGIYSRISYEFPWLRDNICKGSSNPPKYLNCTSKDFNPPALTETQSSVSPVKNPITLRIEIDFDDNSRDNGYFLERIDDMKPVPVSKILPGAFAFVNSYSQDFTIERNDLYSFTFFDTQNDGLNYGGGSFTSGVQYFFYATFGKPKTSFEDSPNFGDNKYLTLQIDFDEHPEETGVEVFMDGERILYRPPRFYYPYVLSTRKEHISIPSGFHEYELIITDTFGDGFSETNGAGYSLWEGDADIGRLLVQGSFAYGYSTSWKFTSCDLSIGCNKKQAAKFDHISNNSSGAVFTLPPASSPSQPGLRLDNSKTSFVSLTQNVPGFSNLFVDSPVSSPLRSDPIPPESSSIQIIVYTVSSTLLYIFTVLYVF